MCGTDFIKIFYHCPRCYHPKREGSDGFDVCQACFLPKAQPDQVADLRVADCLSPAPLSSNGLDVKSDDECRLVRTCKRKAEEMDPVFDTLPDPDHPTAAAPKADLTADRSPVLPPLSLTGLEAVRTVENFKQDKKRRRRRGKGGSLEPKMKFWTPPSTLEGPCHYVAVNEVLRARGVKSTIPLQEFRKAIVQAGRSPKYSIISFFFFFLANRFNYLQKSDNLF